MNPSILFSLSFMILEMINCMNLSKTLDEQHQVQAETKNACDNEHRMPNIGYILRGYDIYYGNPLPTVTGLF